VKNARCSFENSLRVAFFPDITAFTAFGSKACFNDPEQTNAPGIASTSTPKLGDCCK